MRRLLPTLLLAACYGEDPNYVTAGEIDPEPDAEPLSLRVATFNVALHGNREGDVLRRVQQGTNEQCQGIAAILQDVRPDIVLLNEVDWDADGQIAELLHDNFLAQPQGEREGLLYPYVYVARSNTGVPSGHDLDGDGQAVSSGETEERGNDSFGFGVYEGQYSFVVYSTLPLNPARTFREVRWADMPGNAIPDGFYSDEALEVFRLSSKNHVDLPVTVGETDVHLLLSHPTPPSFDGPEDRNGRRNHDEIRFWADFVEGADWIVDDQGTPGGVGSEYFVVLGDLNADPNDGDSYDQAIRQLIDHPNFADPEPTSAGAAEQNALQGGVNDDHLTGPALDTADFDDRSVGNLRLDYVLPSATLPVDDAGVYWPLESEDGFEFVGTYPFPVSDHRLVWVDLLVPQP